MTLLPRMTTSPIVAPSRGTSRISSSTTRTGPRSCRPGPGGRAGARAPRPAARASRPPPRAHRVRAVGLGQPVDVDDADVELLHARRAASATAARPRPCAVTRALERAGVRVVDERDLDRRRAVVVRHALLAEQPPDQPRIDLAQADVRAAGRGHRPREAPAVAVEHRQRPQVDRVVAELGLDHLAERVQVRAAVGVDDALRAAGRARGVVDRDRLLLVAQQRRHAGRVAGGDAAARTSSPEPHDLDAVRAPSAASGSSSGSTNSSRAPECSRM